MGASSSHFLAARQRVEMANRGSSDFGGKNSGIGADNKVSWSEAKFLSTVPSFLQKDADILRLAAETRYEEERRKRLEAEVKSRMEGIASNLTTWNRRSGF